MRSKPLSSSEVIMKAFSTNSLLTLGLSSMVLLVQGVPTPDESFNERQVKKGYTCCSEHPIGTSRSGNELSWSRLIRRLRILYPRHLQSILLQPSSYLFSLPESQNSSPCAELLHTDLEVPLWSALVEMSWEAIEELACTVARCQKRMDHALFSQAVFLVKSLCRRRRPVPFQRRMSRSIHIHWARQYWNEWIECVSFVGRIPSKEEWIQTWRQVFDGRGDFLLLYHFHNALHFLFTKKRQYLYPLIYAWR